MRTSLGGFSGVFRLLTALVGAFLGFIAMGATLWLLNHALTPNATWYLNNEGIPLGGRNVLPYMAIVFLVFPAVGIIVAVMLFRRITKPKPNDSP